MDKTMVVLVFSIILAFIAYNEDVIIKELKSQNVQLEQINKNMHSSNLTHLQSLMVDLKAIRENKEKVYV